MKAKIIAFLLSKSGWLIKGPIYTGLGILVAWLANKGIEPPQWFLEKFPEWQSSLAAFLVAAVGGALEAVLRAPEDKNKILIQKELGIPKDEQDGYHGPDTLKAAVLATPSPQITQKKKRTAGLKHQNRP